MTIVEYLAVLAVAMIGLGLVEYGVHRRRLNRIPIRIHVAGTRGKSSVTRLIAAGLNGAGIPTVAKTTGTLARMILPEGREIPVYRPSGANIIEQKRIVHAACSIGARAVVMECMALQPLLHWVLEHRIVHATHGIITNARADHLDVMGPGEIDVAKALAGMVPRNGTLFTSEQRHIQVFEDAAKDRNTRMEWVPESAFFDVSDEDLKGFAYSEHKENVALALRVLAEFGVDRETAMKGMWNTRPDPGALTEYDVNFFGRRIVFINGFAANDPESTERIWDYAREKYADLGHRIGVFNLRADRPSRTLQMARDATFWHQADRIVLMGTGAYLFARIAAKVGIDPYRFIVADAERTEDIFESIIDACQQNSLVVGMGNIGGQGLNLARYFQNRAMIESES